jgi:hypothetical protein
MIATECDEHDDTGEETARPGAPRCLQSRRHWIHMTIKTETDLPG